MDARLLADNPGLLVANAAVDTMIADDHATWRVTTTIVVTTAIC